jgi:PAT family beta-lactamase induction signal transducer AmpG
MSQENGEKRSWREILISWSNPRAVTMLFLGFSAGIPILLIFSTLSVWLREAGVSRTAVTFFSWAALGYSFKFIWAPLVDLLPLPILSRILGRRRSWLLVAQILIIIAIASMGLIDPAATINGLTVMAIAAVLLGFSSATQDIVIDAYRIESAEESMQALLASMYIAGYRVGMLVAGAGSLYLASWFGTSRGAYDYSAWRMTYMGMAAVMLIGVVTTLVIPEPQRSSEEKGHRYSTLEYVKIIRLFVLTAAAFACTFFYGGKIIAELRVDLLEHFPLSGKTLGFGVETVRFGTALSVAGLVSRLLILSNLVDRSMVDAAYIQPIREFLKRYSGKTAILLLVLVGCYRLSDIVLGVVSNVFYVDLGFSNNEIATVTKTFGLGMTLLGGFLGGMFTIRFGVFRILFAGALLSAATNLLFMLLARSGADISLLTLVIAADNLSAGLATTAFVAFLSALTSVSFTAVQYAIFSSVMSLFPKLLGGYSGTMVSSFGYETFFLITAGLGVPVLVLIWMVRGTTKSE